MLSMSSDTLESSTSREWAPVDYGPSRSSTPDSSASSRLAAQLERSAYRRSRSNNRRRQSSNNSNLDDRKPRNKRSKTQQSQRNHAHVQDDMTKMKGSFVVESSQKSSMRRTLTSDDDETQLLSGSNPTMSYSRTVNDDNCKEHRFSEPDDDTKIVTAYPVGTYSVSCVSVAENNPHSLNYITEDLPRKTDSVDVVSRPCQPREGVQNGMYSDRGQNGFLSNRHGQQTATDRHFDDRRNAGTGMSRVRFEESWEDTTARKVGYKIRENSTIVKDSRGDRSSTYAPNGDKPAVDLRETVDANSKINSPKHWQGEEKRRNVVVSTLGEDENENTAYRKVNTTMKREGSEISRLDDSKPLGLRQLIKIHEVQIAEVAKSAAAMKRPTGKFPEGRLVKVKVVPEIETKQTHMKRHAAKISFPGNKNSIEVHDDTNTSPRNTGQRSDVKIISMDNQESGKDEQRLKVDQARTVAKPKRHTVELRRTKPPVLEDQKWKRHTAIGLVGFDLPESRERLEVNGWSTTGKYSEPFASDSDLDVEYMRKQQVEPEKQVVDEKVKKCDIIDLKTPRLNEVNEVLMFHNGYSETPENELEQNEVPPERPPLPENFYSSTDEIQRPPPPIMDVAVLSTQIQPENLTLNNDIIKPAVVDKKLCDDMLSRSLPAVHISTTVLDVQSKEDGLVKSENNEEERDTVLGNSRTTREMYEERLARINLVPLDRPDGIRRNQEIVSSACTSLESFKVENNVQLSKSGYFEKLKNALKQVKLLAREKDEMGKKFELELRDWKRKYEDQHKVANAYQKLEDRYRRRVEELQTALMQCTCSNVERRKTLLLRQSGKKVEPYFFNSQTQSILDETEEWLKEQSVRSETINNSANISNNVRTPNGNSLHGSLSDVTGGTDWVANYKDIDLTADIDQYNGTSV